MKEFASRFPDQSPSKKYAYKKGAHCYWCNMEVSYRKRHKQMPFAATREHIIPRSMGGASCWPNIVVACRACNEARGRDMTWQAGHHTPMFTPNETPAAERKKELGRRRSRVMSILEVMRRGA